MVHPFASLYYAPNRMILIPPLLVLLVWFYVRGVGRRAPASGGRRVRCGVRGSGATAHRAAGGAFGVPASQRRRQRARPVQCAGRGYDGRRGGGRLGSGVFHGAALRPRLPRAPRGPALPRRRRRAPPPPPPRGPRSGRQSRRVAPADGAVCVPSGRPSRTLWRCRTPVARVGGPSERCRPCEGAPVARTRRGGLRRKPVCSGRQRAPPLGLRPPPAPARVAA